MGKLAGPKNKKKQKKAEASWEFEREKMLEGSVEQVVGMN